MSKPQMLMLALSSIVIGKTNPRKVFDEDAINELAQSVKEKGVIQPILVRPLPEGKYELVCGERRYRASQLAAQYNAAVKEIPAYIRELTDEEALELQITENLQRKDVHPMEEAYAFKVLMEKFTDEEVAARVGKKPYFVRQRVKLNELNTLWQKLFYKNHIQLTTAIKICALPDKFQVELLAKKGINAKSVDACTGINLSDWEIDRYRGLLKKAPFKLDDASLDKKMGACSNCPFNSAVASLFPDGEDGGICSNVTCFSKKCDAHLNKEVKVALQDPAMVFVVESYNIPDNPAVELVKKESHTILRQNYDYSTIDEPELETYEDFKEGYDEDTPETEIKADYDKEVKDHSKAIEQFNKEVASGKCIKAFVIGGNNIGKYVYINLKKKAEDKSAKKKVEAGAATVDDITAEIGRIRDRQKRNKELDREKVHAEVHEALGKSAFLTTDTPLTDNEYIALAVAVYSKTHDGRNVLNKELKLDGWDYNHINLYKKLVAKSPEDMTKLVNRFLRNFMYTELKSQQNPDPEKKGGPAAIRAIAQEYIALTVKDLDLQQLEVAEKRQDRVEKKIESLNKAKKELATETKQKAKDGGKVPATKKVASKKAAPKKAAPVRVKSVKDLVKSK